MILLLDASNNQLVGRWMAASRMLIGDMSEEKTKKLYSNSPGFYDDAMVLLGVLKEFNVKYARVYSTQDISAAPLRVATKFEIEFPDKDSAMLWKLTWWGKDTL